MNGLEEGETWRPVDQNLSRKEASKGKKKYNWPHLPDGESKRSERFSDLPDVTYT